MANYERIAIPGKLNVDHVKRKYSNVRITECSIRTEMHVHNARNIYIRAHYSDFKVL